MLAALGSKSVLQNRKLEAGKQPLEHQASALHRVHLSNMAKQLLLSPHRKLNHQTEGFGHILHNAAF